MDLQKILDKAVLGLFQGKQSAFLTTIYCGLQFSWNTAIPTACTNGRTLIINPDWFLTLTERSRIALLAHELWHVAFMHMIRVGARNWQLFNMAADHAINLMLLDHGYFFDMPCLADPRFRGMSTEEIYKTLETEATKIYLPFGEDFSDPNQGKHKDLEKEDSAIIEAEITNLIVRASTMEKISGNGALPGEIEEALDKLLNPVIPWERLLQRWLTEHSDVGVDWSRPNRRYPSMYLPSRGGEQGLTHILWAIDCSGSMTSAQLLRINSEIKGAQDQFRPERMTVVSFDTVIHDRWEFSRDKDLTNLVIHGRGGTDMDEVFELARTMRPEVMVMFSDMCCNIPDEIRGIAVLWVCFDNPDWEAPYGNVVHIDSRAPTTA